MCRLDKSKLNSDSREFRKRKGARTVQDPPANRQPPRPRAVRNDRRASRLSGLAARSLFGNSSQTISKEATNQNTVQWTVAPRRPDVTGKLGAASGEALHYDLVGIPTTVVLTNYRLANNVEERQRHEPLTTFTRPSTDGLTRPRRPSRTAWQEPQEDTAD